MEARKFEEEREVSGRRGTWMEEERKMWVRCSGRVVRRLGEA